MARGLHLPASARRCKVRPVLGPLRFSHRSCSSNFTHQPCQGEGSSKIVPRDSSKHPLGQQPGDPSCCPQPLPWHRKHFAGCSQDPASILGAGGRVKGAMHRQPVGLGTAGCGADGGGGERMNFGGETGRLGAQLSSDLYRSVCVCKRVGATYTAHVSPGVHYMRLKSQRKPGAHCRSSDPAAWSIQPLASGSVLESSSSKLPCKEVRWRICFPHHPPPQLFRALGLPLLTGHGGSFQSP